jgi:hypothetical protein
MGGFESPGAKLFQKLFPAVKSTGPAVIGRNIGLDVYFFLIKICSKHHILLFNVESV